MTMHFRYRTDLIFNEQSLRIEDNICSPENFDGKKTYLLTDRTDLDHLEPKLGPLISSLSGFSDDEIQNSVFYIFFNFDSDALPFLKRIVKCGGIFVPPTLTGKIEYHYTNPLVHLTLMKTASMEDIISHFYYPIHNNIIEAIEITKNLDGAYVEIGVYKGGSALTAANYIKFLSESNQIKDRKLFLLDTYDGFNYEEAKNSPDQIWKNTHKLYGVEKTMKHVYDVVKTANTDFVLMENNICTGELPEEIKSIAVANIDVDMYEPTLSALNKVTDLVASGGIIICEDAASTPGLYGAYLAMEEFLSTEKGQQYIKVFKGSQYFLIKK